MTRLKLNLTGNKNDCKKFTKSLSTLKHLKDKVKIPLGNVAVSYPTFNLYVPRANHEVGYFLKNIFSRESENQCTETTFCPHLLPSQSIEAHLFSTTVNLIQLKLEK